MTCLFFQCAVCSHKDEKTCSFIKLEKGQLAACFSKTYCVLEFAVILICTAF